MRRLLFVAIALALPVLAAAQSKPHGRLFPPEELGLLEGPDREAYQRPGEVMDALGIADGSVVADVGAGGGWFTIRLARRVGPRGLVVAEDVQPQMLEAIDRRVQREGLRNVRITHGNDEDPGLRPNTFDAVLIVDAYYEMANRVSLLKNIRGALKPGGRLGIVDFKREGGGPGPDLDDRVDPEEVKKDAQEAGLRLLELDNSLPFHYLLIFGK